MQSKTLEYTSLQQLNGFVERNELFASADNLLVQVFTSQNNYEFIKRIQNEILTVLPNAKIIGTTTSGEISENGASHYSTIISFSIFKNTTIHTTLKEYTHSSYRTGEDIMDELNKYNKNNDLKLIISFTDGLIMNGEEYLNGITSINSDVIVAGGMAGDNSKFQLTLVFDNTQVVNNGAVAVGLYNKDLEVHTECNFNWETVGKQHIIEKAHKNRVYRINGMTAVDFYKYYLGNDIEKLLPSIGIEFPLVMSVDGINQARAVLTKHDDGSLSFAGNVPEGSIVQFGHGDVQMIIEKGLNNVSNILNYPIESIFIYSCMARHSLLQSDINLEILPLRKIAPIAGFFSYGEFYHDTSVSKNKLLNQTMTIIAISEKTQLVEHITPNIFSHNPPHVDTINLYRTQALSSLIEKTTKELYDLNAHLEQRVEKELQKNIENENIIQMMQAHAQLGDMIEMIIHQWRQPLSSISTAVSSAQVYKTMDMLTDDIINSTFNNILKYTEHLNSTIDDFRDLFKVNLKFSKITLENLIEKSLTIINPMLKAKSINIIKEFENDSYVNVPISLMMQVIINILKNAIDILIEKEISSPIIKIKTYIKNDRCVIKIFDNGGGIPVDILPLIFNPRFTTKAETDGTGIGLNMSKNIIEKKLGGKLTANNSDGWAVFNIKIPLVKN